MAWVKIDDQFADHPKAAEAGPLGIAMQVAALCYSNRHLTDGFISCAVSVRLLDFTGLAEEVANDHDLDDSHVEAFRINWLWVIEKLVRAGLWEEAPGGWQIHDYLEYNPSRADTLAKRAADLERKKTPQRTPSASARNPNGIHMESKRPVPDPVPDPEEESRDRVSLAVEEGVQGEPARGGGAHAPRTRPAPLPAPRFPKPKDAPPRENPLWDALVAGIGVTPATTSERALFGKVVGELGALGATPDDVLRRCAHYREAWPNVSLTPTALMKHWSGMEHPPPRDKLNGRHQPGLTARNLAALKEAF